MMNDSRSILCVTANTTIDQTVFVDELKKNETLRATRTIQSIAGKATDAAYILGTLGVPAQVVGCAAGALGRKVESLLSGRGVTADFVQVNGETRLNIIVIDDYDRTTTTITVSTLDVLPQHVIDLRMRYAALLGNTSVVVAGGTLPAGMQPSFYHDIVSQAVGRGVPVILDATEANLSAGLLARPTYIKPNRIELSDFAGYRVETLDQAYSVGRAIHDAYGTQSIVTMDREGALAVLSDRAYHIPALNIPVVSTAGAGDAVVAGVAASIHRRQPVEDGLRLGIAAAAAVCMQPGTAECDPRDVERLLPRVELIPYVVN